MTTLFTLISSPIWVSIVIFSLQLSSVLYQNRNSTKCQYTVKSAVNKSDKTVHSGIIQEQMSISDVLVSGVGTKDCEQFWCSSLHQWDLHLWPPACFDPLCVFVWPVQNSDKWPLSQHRWVTRGCLFGNWALCSLNGPSFSVLSLQTYSRHIHILSEAL